MSRIDTRLVRVHPEGGEPFELPCVWIPRSGGKVLALWRIGGGRERARVLTERESWTVLKIGPNDDVTEAATLERTP